MSIVCRGVISPACEVSPIEMTVLPWPVLGNGVESALMATLLAKPSPATVGLPSIGPFSYAPRMRAWYVTVKVDDAAIGAVEVNVVSKPPPASSVTDVYGNALVVTPLKTVGPVAIAAHSASLEPV